VNGYSGDLDITVGPGDRDETFKVGTVVVATGSEEMKPGRSSALWTRASCATRPLSAPAP